ncbi:MAG: hypothetical protein R3E79_32600 [Caldilineaceae bacterium]
MTTSVSRPCCPHLGLNSDRTIMLMTPTMAHRCYGQAEPLLPDPDRQSTFCLTANHPACPLYAPFVAQRAELAAVGSEQALPITALALSPSSSSTPSTHWVRVPQPPAANAKRILLPRRQQLRPAHRKPQKPLLLPAVSSYSVRRLHRWSFLSTKVTLWATLLLIGLTLTSGLFLRRQQLTDGRAYRTGGILALGVAPSPTFTKTPVVAAVAVVNSTTNSTTPGDVQVVADSPAVSNAAALDIPATPTPVINLERFTTPTPPPGGQVYTLTPGGNSVGWWMSNDTRRNHINDSFLYVGQNQNETHIAAIRFDLRNLPRGAEIVYSELRLTGVRTDNLAATAPATWQVQLIAEEALPNPASADFLALLSAPASFTLLPTLSERELTVGGVNTWEFDADVRQWLQQQVLRGATSVTLRMTADTDGQETLFAWDSGIGAATSGKGPALLISTGAAPATPPVLPTKPFVVATLTPAPENVLTVVALNSTATAIAVTTGTYTPMPYQVLTPTPFPANLETVQAVALDRNLPPVLLHTPTPANPAIATGDAQYATAVAITTGTFTPVPTDFVTPVLIIPSPPAENVATVAARSIEATQVAASGAATPTPLPYNAVVAEYIYATSLPDNEATAVAQAVIATAAAQVDGTPTPLPWSAIVITKIPTPLPPVSPTPTPLPSLQPVTDFTPTPTPTVYLIPDVMPEIYRNKIIFKTNRSGREEIYALDPNSGELFRVNESWVHTLAYRQVPLSPDGNEQALVMADPNRVLQIQVRSLQYGTVRQLTSFQTMSYDPAWSPLGDKIAFVGTDSGSDEIYLVSVDGTVLQQLTANNNLWDKHPTWSPDGSKLVFFSNRETNRRQLWMMNADGSDQHNISNNPYEDWDPIWVP